MAIFGSFRTVRAQLAQDPRFAAAFAYLAEAFDAGSIARARINAAAVGTSGKIPLSGDAFAIEQVYHSKPRPETFFESHVKYIDVQAIVEGAEQMEVAGIGDLKIAQPYEPERDFIKYADTDAPARLRMRAGDVAVFFPADGHMTTLQLNGAVLVRKTVVKVPAG